MRATRDGILQIVDGKAVAFFTFGEVPNRIPFELSVINGLPRSKSIVERRIIGYLNTVPLIVRETVARMCAQRMRRGDEESNFLDLERFGDPLDEARRKAIEVEMRVQVS